MKGYMYILECANGMLYVGSTRDLVQRVRDHATGFGSNFTRKYAPCQLVYYEEYDRIDEAFNREKQIQGWSRKKKRALIDGRYHELPLLAECQNFSHFKFREAREQLNRTEDNPNKTGD